MAQEGTKPRRVTALPAIGALIVLATFVIKEGFRDHYKDQASTADTARLLYQQDNQLGEIAERIEAVRRVVEHQVTRAGENYNTFYQLWISYEGQIERLQELLEKISAPRKDADALAELKILNTQFQQAITQYGQATDAGGDADPSRLASRSGVIFLKRQELGESLLGLASTEARESERRSARFTIMSYFLYGVGWVLSFMGKLLRVPGMELPTLG